MSPITSKELKPTQVEVLKKSYFKSVVVSVKVIIKLTNKDDHPQMQGSMMGYYTNADMDILYEKVLNDGVQIEAWPEWITSEIKKLSLKIE